MIDTLLQIIAPHHCSGCGETGTLLCDNCKYDITSEPFPRCFACGVGLAAATGICGQCRRLPYQRAWCVGERSDALQRLIGSYKFTNAKAAYAPLSDLLDQTMPDLPGVIIVPVPTIARHIRQRGYDHMALIARHFARRRGLPYSPILLRATTTQQRDASRSLRATQAKQAFRCQAALDPDVIYLLLDDVVTTGATMKYAAKTLRAAGARTVWAATISRQMLM